MDYEKKYKKALEYIKECVPDENGFITIYPQEVFPELKESDDERISKEIISYIKNSTVCIDTDTFKKWIAWLENQGDHANFLSKIQVGDKVTRNENGVLVNLSQLDRIAKKDEKQGEQKPYTSETMNEKRDFDSGFTKMMENKQKPADKSEPMSLDEAIEHCKEKSCGNNACALEHKQLEKWLIELKELKEQKNAWSEEDEKIYQSIIDDTVQENQLDDKQTNWLKFLKERYTWKPSCEQMKALYKLLNCSTSGWDFNSLNSLYNDLKKLRKE